MEKNITILFLLASGWTSVHSQSPVYVYHNSSSAKPDRNIIRENNIAYCEEESSGIGYFAYLSSLSDNSPINRVKLPPQWSIWDFHVVDSIAVFCGTNSVSDKALLGYFHIGELMAGTSVTFRDVVVTDSFFVTAGTLSSNKIIMRSLPKGTTSFTTDCFKEQELVSSTTSNGNSTSYGFSMYDEIYRIELDEITGC